MEKKLTHAILYKNKSYTPIWLMRQAGRYLPEYMSIRSKFSNFLDLCYSVEAAAEITLQPIKRFGFDAAILFSDILVVPHILGMEVRFKKDHGPELKVISEEKEIYDLKVSKENYQFEKISQTIKIIRSELDNNIDLIGFAGSPWTVLTYMIEKDRKNQFNVIRSLIYENPTLIKKLIDIITEQTIYYLVMQVESGVNVIQLFDTWAGVLRKDHYNEYVIKPTKIIVKFFRTKYPHIPMIGFPKGSGSLYEKYVKDTQVNAISVDYTVDLELLKNTDICIQGNLDPVLLTIDDKTILKFEIDKVLNFFKNKKHIFNLGHGILPNTIIENVEFLVEYIRNRV